MPLYEYICDACHKEMEILQKISDSPIKHCPHCGKDRMRKLVSASAFQLKGTGWYATDFKDKPKSTKQKTDVDKKDPPKKEESKTPGKKDEAAGKKGE